MAELTEAGLLALWEAGLGQTWPERALALAAAASDADVGELADLTVGGRDALVLTLRRRCFGPHLPCRMDCPSCGDPLELTLAVDDILFENPGPAPGPLRAEIAGREVTFRALTSRDLLAVPAGSPDARRALVASCVVETREGDERVPADTLTDELVDTVAARLGEADPQADVVIATACPSCGQEWNAPFDPSRYVWSEIDAYARRLLHDIRDLALAFGWTETDVLAVSPARRQFYLDGASR
jgi:hypothetical protein